MNDYIPKLNFTLEKHLEICAENDKQGNAQILLESFHTIRKNMKSNLETIIFLFPHYSDHGEQHSEHIISAIERLLGEKRIQQLTIAETWVILVSAYIHDIGMIVLDEELKQDWKSDAFQAFLKDCERSADSDIQQAAGHLLHTQWIGKELDSAWPIRVKKDVILLAAEFYRRKHASRVKETLKLHKIKQLLDITISGAGTIPPRLQNTIAQISMGHGGNFESMISSLEPCDSLCEYDFHPRFIASLIRLGDLCDLDNGRFNKMVVKVFGDLTATNYVHYFKHESVRSFSIRTDRISVVSDISFQEIKETLRDDIFEDLNEEHIKQKKLELCHQVLLETKNWLSWMEEEIKNIKLHWHDIADDTIPTFSPSLDYKILVNGRKSVTSQNNMRFQFSNEKAYTLIEGYSLYDDQLIFVRELIQNSLDALKMQFWRDLQASRLDYALEDFKKRMKYTSDQQIKWSELSPFDFNYKVYEQYQVKVKVTHQEGDSTAIFEIEDNGTGISMDDLQNRILKTGSSWHDTTKAKEMDEMPQWLRPTGSFGIGLHSVYALTNSIYIQTKTEHDPLPHDILLHSGKRDGYVFMNANEEEIKPFCRNSSRGTRIILILDISQLRRTDHNDLNKSPFSPQPASQFGADIEHKIENLFHSPLFGIYYNCTGEEKNKTSPTLYTADRFKNLFDSTRRNILYEDKKYTAEHFPYTFTLADSGTQITLWDQKKSILFDFRLHTVQETKIFCKGVKVNAEQIQKPFTFIDLYKIDILGGDSGEIVSASRNQLTKNEKEIISQILQDNYQILADIYQHLIAKLIDDYNVNTWIKQLEQLAKDIITDDVEKNRPENWKETMDKIILESSTEGIKHPSLFYHRIVIRLFFHFQKNVLLQLFSDISLEKDDNKKSIFKNIGKLQITKLLKYICFSYFLSVSHKNFDEESADAFDWAFDDRIDRAFVRAFASALDSAFDRAVDSAFDSTVDLAVVTALTKALDSAFGKEFNWVAKRTFDWIFDRAFDWAVQWAFDWAIARTVDRSFDWAFAKAIVSTFDWAVVSVFDRAFDWASNKILNGIDLYLFLPLYQVTWLIISNQKEIPEALYEYIGFTSVPEFNYGYGFFEKNTIKEILTSSHLEILEDNLKPVLAALPLFHQIPCCELSLNEKQEIVVHFDMQNRNHSLIQINNHDILKYYLNKHNQTLLLPALTNSDKLYDAIAIGTWYDDSDIPICCTKNYYMVLWKPFNEMEDYLPRLTDEENKNALIDEIMSISDLESNGVPNLLKYIYRHKAIKDDKPYQEVMQDIKATYRKFVSDVLDCLVEISKEHDKTES